ncbi:MAG: hypothetical protein Kow0090_03700 [Myxococcota bacterium]
MVDNGEKRTGHVRRTNPDIVIENDRRARDKNGRPIDKRPKIPVDPGERQRLNTILIIVLGVALLVVIMYLYGRHDSIEEYNKRLEKRIELLEKQPTGDKK